MPQERALPATNTRLPGRHLCKEKSLELTWRLLSRVGSNIAAFNLEFIWNEFNDDLKLIEVNPRTYG
jgi:biotin carboxylase